VKGLRGNPEGGEGFTEGNPEGGEGFAGETKLTAGLSLATDPVATPPQPPRLDVDGLNEALQQVLALTSGHASQAALRQQIAASLIQLTSAPAELERQAAAQSLSYTEECHKHWRTCKDKLRAVHSHVTSVQSHLQDLQLSLEALTTEAKVARQTFKAAVKALPPGTVFVAPAKTSTGQSTPSASDSEMRPPSTRPPSPRDEGPRLPAGGGRGGVSQPTSPGVEVVDGLEVPPLEGSPVPHLEAPQPAYFPGTARVQRFRHVGWVGQWECWHGGPPQSCPCGPQWTGQAQKRKPGASPWTRPGCGPRRGDGRVRHCNTAGGVARSQHGSCPNIGGADGRWSSGRILGGFPQVPGPWGCNVGSMTSPTAPTLALGIRPYATPAPLGGLLSPQHGQCLLGSKLSPVHVSGHGGHQRLHRLGSKRSPGRGHLVRHGSASCMTLSLSAGGRLGSTTSPAARGGGDGYTARPTAARDIHVSAARQGCARPAYSTGGNLTGPLVGRADGVRPQAPAVAHRARQYSPLPTHPASRWLDFAVVVGLLARLWTVAGTSASLRGVLLCFACASSCIVPVAASADAMPLPPGSLSASRVAMGPFDAHGPQPPVGMVPSTGCPLPSLAVSYSPFHSRSTGSRTPVLHGNLSPARSRVPDSGHRRAWTASAIGPLTRQCSFENPSLPEVVLTSIQSAGPTFSCASHDAEARGVGIRLLTFGVELYPWYTAWEPQIQPRGDYTEPLCALSLASCFLPRYSQTCLFGKPATACDCSSLIVAGDIAGVGAKASIRNIVDHACLVPAYEMCRFGVPQPELAAALGPRVRWGSKPVVQDISMFSETCSAFKRPASHSCATFGVGGSLHLRGAMEQSTPRTSGFRTPDSFAYAEYTPQGAELVSLTRRVVGAVPADRRLGPR
jgi:hypothetical protein